MVEEKQLNGKKTWFDWTLLMRANERRLTKMTPVKYIFHQMSTTHKCVGFFYITNSFSTLGKTQNLIQKSSLRYMRYLTEVWCCCFFYIAYNAHVMIFPEIFILCKLAKNIKINYCTSLEVWSLLSFEQNNINTFTYIVQSFHKIWMYKSLTFLRSHWDNVFCLWTGNEEKEMYNYC